MPWNNHAKFDCGTVGTVDLTFYSFNEIDSIDGASAGWYCWFYVPDEPESIAQDFVRMYRPIAQVTGIFGTSYSGVLQASEQEPHTDNPPDFQNLQKLCVAFAPPLYIGISKNLGQRLKAHRRQLLDEFFSGEIRDDPDIGFESDSEEESSYFAKRVAREMRRFGVTPEELYVKCLVAPDARTLRPLEKVVNRMFLPAYGRR